MTIQNPFARAPRTATEGAGYAMAHADVQWGRPIFRPPPLNVKPPLLSVKSFLSEFCRFSGPRNL